MPEVASSIIELHALSEAASYGAADSMTGIAITLTMLPEGVGVRGVGPLPPVIVPWRDIAARQAAPLKAAIDAARRQELDDII